MHAHIASCLGRVLLGLALSAVLGLEGPDRAHAGLNQWTSSGPDGGCVSSLAVDSNAPAAVYVTTCEDGIFVSRTGGASWTNGNLATARSVVVDPQTPTILYALTGKGLFKSLDGGGLWSLLTSVQFTAVTIDPTNGNTLYACIAGYGGMGGILKSTDGGATWTPVATGLPNVAFVVATAVVVDPQTPSIVYLSTCYGIFKSTDAAAHWNPSSTGLPNTCIGPLAIDPETPARLYTGTADHGVYKSADGGASWKASGLPGVRIDSLNIDPHTRSTVYAVAATAVFKSIDFGETWTPLPGLPGRVRAVAVEPQTPTTIYAATPLGIYKSTNAGGSWIEVNHGIPANIGLISPLGSGATVAHPYDPAIVLAGSRSRGVYRSTDGGGVWTLLTPSVRPSVLAVDPQAPDTIYAGGCSGVSKSTDAGRTWTSSSLLGNVETIVVDPTDGSVLYAIVESDEFSQCFTQSGRLVRSANAGTSWGNVPSPSLGFGVTAAAIGSGRPATLYVGKTDGLYSTADGGVTSSQILTVATNAIVIDPRNPATIYAGTGSGVLKSTDSGLHWSARTLEGFAITALALDPQDPVVLYAGTLSQGVFRSGDGASTWNPMSDGLPPTPIRSVSVSASGSCVYAGAGGTVYAFAARLDPCLANVLAAAVLPSSRSAQAGEMATAFVTIINPGSTSASQVGISLATPLEATFMYQTTNPVTNQLTGAPGTPVDIPPGQSQSYVIALTSTAPFAPTNVTLAFAGTSTAPPSTVVGVNTLLLSASATPVPDIVALAATINNDGIVNVPNPAAASPLAGVFAVATVNVGAGGTITVSTDTGGVSLPLSISVCQTTPVTGACQGPHAASVTTQIDTSETPTFGIFVNATSTVPFDPANNRIFVRFKDGGGVTRGATSVAVRTQ